MSGWVSLGNQEGVFLSTFENDVCFNTEWKIKQAHSFAHLPALLLVLLWFPIFSPHHCCTILKTLYTCMWHQILREWLKPTMVVTKLCRRTTGLHMFPPANATKLDSGPGAHRRCYFQNSNVIPRAGLWTWCPQKAFFSRIQLWPLRLDSGPGANRKHSFPESNCDP